VTNFGGVMGWRRRRRIAPISPANTLEFNCTFVFLNENAKKNMEARRGC
jgi:hypothetical protein